MSWARSHNCCCPKERGTSLCEERRGMISPPVLACGSSPRRYFSSRARLASESSVVFDITPFPFIFGRDIYCSSFPKRPCFPAFKRFRIESLLKLDRQGGQSAQAQALAPLQRPTRQAQPGPAPERRLQPHLPLNSRQRSPNAQNPRPPTTHVPVV